MNILLCRSGEQILLNGHASWVPVVHTCNSSHSGGKDQKDYGSRSAQENSSRDPILKKTITKEGLVE
jgi:hypothetical protein